MKNMASSKNASREQPDNNIFLQHAAMHTIYWYDVNSTINPFKQLKRTLESKLTNFKIFENC